MQCIAYHPWSSSLSGLYSFCSLLLDVGVVYINVCAHVRVIFQFTRKKSCGAAIL